MENRKIDEATVETLHERTGQNISVKTANGEKSGVLIDLSETSITLKKMMGKSKGQIIRFENISQISTQGKNATVLYEN